MSDRDRILNVLRAAGSWGVHSHDLRKLGYSGNPSQRIAELVAEGHRIEGRIERRNGRHGKRWKLVGVGAATASVSPEDIAGGAPGGSSDPGQAPATYTEPLRGPARLFDPAPLLPHDQEAA